MIRQKQYKVTSDVFDILQELYQIDPQYSVIWTKNRQYELHYGYGKHSYQFSFAVLDQRVIKKVYQTRTNPYHSKKIFYQLEKDNQKRKEKQEQTLLDQTKYQLQKMYQYLMMHDCLDGAYQDQWY